MIKLIYKTLIIFLITISFCYAKQDDDEVNCPSVSVVKQNYQKIDTANVYGDDNVATTSTEFYANNYYWYISAHYLNGRSNLEVIKNGKEAVKSINFGQEKTDSDYAHICYYKPGYVYASGLYRGKPSK